MCPPCHRLQGCQPFVSRCYVQALSYGGYPAVEVLRTAPVPDQVIAAGNRSIAVTGADGGLAFGPVLDGTGLQTVFDATFFRPINTTFTGEEAPLCRICYLQKLARGPSLGPTRAVSSELAAGCSGQT